MRNYINAAKRRKEETGESGFSLIELIVVVAILGILVAVAIPVFGAIQQNAKDSALENAAASGATVVAAELASGRTGTIAGLLTDSSTDDYTLAQVGTPTDADDACVTATATTTGSLNGGAMATMGPGCP